MLLLGDTLVDKEVVIVLSDPKITRKHRGDTRPLLKFLQLSREAHQVLTQNQRAFNVLPFTNLFDFVNLIRDALHVIFENQLEGESIDIRQVVAGAFEVEQQVLLLGQVHVDERLGVLLGVVHEAAPLVELDGQQVLDRVGEFGVVSVLVQAALAEVDVLEEAVELGAVLAFLDAVHTCLRVLLELVFLPVLARGRALRLLLDDGLADFGFLGHRSLGQDLLKLPSLRGFADLHSHIIKIRTFKICLLGLFFLCCIDL